jgi:DNA topoisomerase-3
VVVETPKGAGCHRWKEGCTFTIWREFNGKQLSDTDIKDLIEKRQTKLIKGFKKKDGTTKYDAKLVLNEEFKVRLEGSAGGSGEGLGACPQCSKGAVRPTPKGAGCSRWREGCTFSVWREVSGLPLTDEQIKHLVVERRTEVIRGFKKKSGTGTFDARLFINDEFKVRFEFDNGPRGPEPQGPEPETGSTTATVTGTTVSATKSTPAKTS